MTSVPHRYTPSLSLFTRLAFNLAAYRLFKKIIRFPINGLPDKSFLASENAPAQANSLPNYPPPRSHSQQGQLRPHRWDKSQGPALSHHAAAESHRKGMHPLPLSTGKATIFLAPAA